MAYWGLIAERHGLDLTVVNPAVDPQFVGAVAGPSCQLLIDA